MLFLQNRAIINRHIFGLGVSFIISSVNFTKFVENSSLTCPASASRSSRKISFRHVKIDNVQIIFLRIIKIIIFVIVKESIGLADEWRNRIKFLLRLWCQRLWRIVDDGWSEGGMSRKRLRWNWSVRILKIKH